MTVIEERLAMLDTIRLAAGGHDPDDGRMCVMEAVAWVAGEAWSDSPVCVSPVLAVFMRAWNDALDDEGRQQLKAVIPRVIGTAEDGQDEARCWLAADWLVRVHTPAWLDLAGIADAAAALRALPELRDQDTLAGAQPALGDARKQAAAARAAAWAAARAAARAAAGAAARDAARAAAGDAAWAAARDAARDAAWDAAWDAARDAAGAAARDAAWAAAGAAAWAAAWAAAGAAARAAARDAAGAAARAAARDALAPTKVALQSSALALLDRMIDPAQGRPA